MDLVVLDHLQRRHSGEDVSDAALIAEHQELMPELGERLREIADLSPQRNEASVDGDDYRSLGLDARALRIRCPYCRQSTEVLSDDDFDQITCSACGSEFSLARETLETREAPSHKKIAQFELIERLGLGSFGTVWKARDTELDRTVAVKIPRRSQLDPGEIEKFLREARAAAQLNHRNIASVYEVGRDKDTVYIVNELIRGVSLADWLTAKRPNFREAATLCAKIADALHHAHENGVIHRDLKPNNIMLDSKDEPHIMDFGLAKREAGEITMTMDGHVLGTPAYMSPEQARGEAHQADRRTDIYSLGVILFELLTGELPFRGNARMLIHQVMNEDAPTPRKLDGSIPQDLETICLKCLEKDASKRYDRAGLVSAELLRVVNGEPIQARPITAPARALRLCKRNPTVAGLALAVFVLLLVGSGISSYYAVLANDRAANEARLRRQAQLRAYAADMNLAQRALDSSNLGRALELLNRNRPAPGNRSDLRDWEWHYLWRVCQSDALSSLAQRSGNVNSVAISHDGNQLAIAVWRQGGVSVWDLRTRREITALSGERVAYSPRELLLAISTISSTNQQPVVRLLSGDSHQTVAELPLEGTCFGLEFSSDGKTLATSTSGQEGQITLWQVPDGERLGSYRAPQDAWGIGTPFDTSDDMSLAAHTPEEGRIRVIDLITGDERWNSLAHRAKITALAFSPNGNILASSALESPASIGLWDVESGTEIGRLDGHRAFIGQFVFWPNGNTLASASGDQTIRLWDLTVSTDRALLRTLVGHQAEVWRLARLPDGVTLVSGAKDGSVYFWDTAVARHEDVAITLPATIDLWRFSSDGKSILTVDQQGRVARWCGAAFQQMEPLVELGENSSGRCFSQDGRLLAARSGDSTVRIWDLKDRTWRELDTGPVNPWTFLDRGNKLVTIADDVGLHVWDLTTNKEMPFLRSSLKALVPNSYRSPLAFSPDEQWCLFGLRDEEEGLLWEAATGHETLLSLDNSALDVAFSPDSSQFAIASETGFVTLRKTATREKIATFRGFLLGVHSVAFSPNGRRLAAGSSGDEAIKLFDVENREEVLTLGAGGDGLFTSTAFSADGNILGSLRYDGVLHLWQTAQR